ncbi:hypothetical protein PAPHI01_2166 [Pancytospora philotis]|nr:hypothetical protein PAPHI01_2166 [Pancytospora philotis]
MNCAFVLGTCSIFCFCSLSAASQSPAGSSAAVTTATAECGCGRISDDNDSEDVCAVCLIPLVSESSNTAGPGTIGCRPEGGHAFHDACMLRWLAVQSGKLTCPVCRSDCGEALNSYIVATVAELGGDGQAQAPQLAEFFRECGPVAAASIHSIEMYDITSTLALFRLVCESNNANLSSFEVKLRESMRIMILSQASIETLHEYALAHLTLSQLFLRIFLEKMTPAYCQGLDEERIYVLVRRILRRAERDADVKAFLCEFFMRIAVCNPLEYSAAFIYRLTTDLIITGTIECLPALRHAAGDQRFVLSRTMVSKLIAIMVNSTYTSYQAYYFFSAIEMEPATLRGPEENIGFLKSFIAQGPSPADPRIPQIVFHNCVVEGLKHMNFDCFAYKHLLEIVELFIKHPCALRTGLFWHARRIVQSLSAREYKELAERLCEGADVNLITDFLASSDINSALYLKSTRMLEIAAQKGSDEQLKALLTEFHRLELVYSSNITECITVLNESQRSEGLGIMLKGLNPLVYEMLQHKGMVPELLAIMRVLKCSWCIAHLLPYIEDDAVLGILTPQEALGVLGYGIGSVVGCHGVVREGIERTSLRGLCYRFFPELVRVCLRSSASAGCYEYLVVNVLSSNETRKYMDSYDARRLFRCILGKENFPDLARILFANCAFEELRAWFFLELLRAAVGLNEARQRFRKQLTSHRMSKLCKELSKKPNGLDFIVTTASKQFLEYVIAKEEKVVARLMTAETIELLIKWCSELRPRQ